MSLIVRASVIGADTGQPVPNASVSFHHGNLTLASTQADQNGFFQLYTTGEPTRMLITSVGYTPISVEMPKYAGLTIYQMEPAYNDLPPVVVTPKKIIKWVMLAVIAAMIYKKK